ncbi:ABC-type sugar transport system, periplasmic component [Ruegeria sp. THAF57]|uniref:sugar ABC transporter substrate-binding protein n=1 Tax=Ruegeria sp. THAF57 TaxID=2744555 RepID=UPI0015DE3FFF|nr:substrate-binding domain-containing protein [Ruegeria sp. THAF57]CAD0186963.1 ABC-type sugar transport system, periplasmic component [Ruegeria sp. THAF57]
MNRFLAPAFGLTLATLAATSSSAAEECEGLNFVFFPGGPEGGTFASVVYNGAVMASEHTGCDVEYVWSDWNSEKMVRQFSEAVARRPDGIAVMGHPGESALSPLIEQAREAGILVTTQNVDLPNIEAKYTADGFGYVGSKNYSSGQNLASGMIRECGVGAGDKVLVWGLLSMEQRGLRTRGSIEVLEEAGVDVDYLEINPDISKDASQGIPVFAAYAAANPDLKGVVVDHGALTALVPTYMKAAGKDAGSICMAGFDLSAATAQGIEDGYITMVLDQQPFLQGYLPIVQMFLSKKFGFAGMNIDTGAAMITKTNVGPVSELAAAAIR